MTKPGPKPSPTALKKLRGNPGRRPLPKEEPRLEAKAPRKPANLKEKSANAARLYDKVARQLGDAGVTTALDEPAFHLMAIHYGLAVAAFNILADEGIVTEDERKLPRKHPVNQLLRDNSTAYLRYAAEFGMTPSSRTRVKKEPDARQLNLADVLFDAID